MLACLLSTPRTGDYFWPRSRFARTAVGNDGVTFIGSVIFFVFWFLICHFVFMKQYISNENARIKEMIDNLERIKGQFRDDR